MQREVHRLFCLAVTRCGSTAIILQQMCSFVNISVVICAIQSAEVMCMHYYERLAWERDCQNITQKEIAAYIGIKQQQYARYEKGVNEMPIGYFMKACEYLHVSADYILGLPKDLPYPNR